MKKLAHQLLGVFAAVTCLLTTVSVAFPIAAEGDTLNNGWASVYQQGGTDRTDRISINNLAPGKTEIVSNKGTLWSAAAQTASLKPVKDGRFLFEVTIPGETLNTQDLFLAISGFANIRCP